FARFLVRRRDNRGIRDGRVPKQCRLALGGRDLIGVVLDQLLDTIDDEEVAALVHISNITGTQPAVRRQRVATGVRPFEIADHDVRPAHPQLAPGVRSQIIAGVEVYDARLHVGPHLPDRAALLRGATERARKGRAGKLSHPETLHDITTDALRAFALDILAERRRSAHDLAQAR